ncbi:hydroxymethylpyrimidine/phosphomethylpyrimidine kinase [Pseudoduganella sp. RAF19]|uniref:bifunctional hydroxymethylpyrimidine kinase/phosphomethylpyrimidine kinase n=2 Tax=unclassified Pseudoduganella TaxID=2637179 RepID=UPI003F99B3C5
MSVGERPCVLVFAGADPSGGAGIAADIQAITALGAHPLPVLTALTVQDNNRVHSVVPVAAEVVLQQARALLAAVPVSAVKIGIPGSAENAAAIVALIAEMRATHRAAAGAAPGWASKLYSDPPVVLDPVLRSGLGDALGAGDATAALAPLLPFATLITPNGPEAAALAQRARADLRPLPAPTSRPRAVADAAASSPASPGVAFPGDARSAGAASAGDLPSRGAARERAMVSAAAAIGAHHAALAHAHSLRALGCQHVLVTGGHDDGEQVVNRWLGPTQQQNWSWPRLQGSFHGSGCTLASAIAALLAQGCSMAQALAKGQGYTQRALSSAYAIAPGQRIPQRWTI